MYEVKFRGKDDKNAVAVVEKATDVQDAVKIMLACGLVSGLDNIFAVYLSPFNEYYPTNDSEQTEFSYFKVVTRVEFPDENTGKMKTKKYYLLVEAATHEDACKRAYDILRQGYDMGCEAISETKIDYVIC